ncbi:MAG TPA: hypothetical protein VHP33_34480, partial [Polyangiaceae bacterium]|nr:hypothetical protein [Polyangiaceae bacterium]
MTEFSGRSCCAQALLTAALFGGVLGCSSEGEPATSPAMGGAGGATSTAGTTSSPGGAGSATAGGSGAGQAGGSAQAGSGGQGGGGGANGGSAGSTSGAGGSGGGGGAGPSGGLTATPDELAFGAVQQTDATPQTIVLKNESAAAVQLMSVKLDAAAPGTPTFELMAPPAAGTSLAAGATANVQVKFRPSGVALFQSSVLVETTVPALKLRVGLFGLGTKGLEGENEPFLKIVLDTLGYDINVGGAGLLSTTTPLVGDEVAAQRFKAAAAGAEVELIPVARYSPEEPIPYGYYTATETQVGVISNDQYQALNPKTDAGSKLSFAAPAGDFGIFTSSKTHKTYTEDSKNAANQVKHAARTYPLKDRAGTPIANAYLVCFEEAANGDYQDYVFTLSNVTPVAP